MDNEQDVDGSEESERSPTHTEVWIRRGFGINPGIEDSDGEEPYSLELSLFDVFLRAWMAIGVLSIFGAFVFLVATVLQIVASEATLKHPTVVYTSLGGCVIAVSAIIARYISPLQVTLPVSSRLKTDQEYLGRRPYSSNRALVTGGVLVGTVGLFGQIVLQPELLNQPITVDSSWQSLTSLVRGLMWILGAIGLAVVVGGIVFGAGDARYGLGYRLNPTVWISAVSLPTAWYFWTLFFTESLLYQRPDTGILVPGLLYLILERMGVPLNNGAIEKIALLMLSNSITLLVGFAYVIRTHPLRRRGGI